MHHAAPLHAKPHMWGACVFSCNLAATCTFGRMTRMCYCSNTGMEHNYTKIRFSAESWPQRRNFCCHSWWDSNLWPFKHESSTLTTSKDLKYGECLPAFADSIAHAVFNRDIRRLAECSSGQLFCFFFSPPFFVRHVCVHKANISMCQIYVYARVIDNMLKSLIIMLNSPQCINLHSY